MRNAGLDEAQARIKIAGRNNSNLRYADDTTLMAESEELKSVLMNGKEELLHASIVCSSLLPNNIPWYSCTWLFIHMSIDGHLVYFQIVLLWISCY